MHGCLILISVHLSFTASLAYSTSFVSVRKGSVSRSRHDRLTLVCLSSEADDEFSHDPNFSEPLPPGSCPFDHTFTGPKSFFRRKSAELGHPNVWKYTFKKAPVVELAGTLAINPIFGREFSSLTFTKSLGVAQYYLGKNSLRRASTAKEHNILRRLVDQSLGRRSTLAAIPFLQEIAMKHVTNMLPYSSKQAVMTMSKIALGYMNNIVWRNIIGLDLTPEEEVLFDDTTRVWRRGLYVKPETPEFEAVLEARSRLVTLIEKKIFDLKTCGQCDDTVVSRMLFATCDENGKSLSHSEVIDNTLLLIFTGTHATKDIIADAVMCLGLNPDTWNSLQQEQNKVESQYGKDITMDLLDKHCPYLDAVVQETLRMNTGMIPSRKVAKDTYVVDGKQIPKGWGVNYNIELTHYLDPKTWKDDGSHMDLEKGFCPERWLEDISKPIEFIPWGVGPRSCPATLTAIVFIKMFLAVMARLVDFDYVGARGDDIKWKKASTVAATEDGVPIVVRRLSNPKLGII